MIFLWNLLRCVLQNGTWWIFMKITCVIEKNVYTLFGIEFYILLNQTWYLYVLVFCMFCGCLCCLVTHSSVTLCDPMDCSTPGFPVLHHLPEFAQTHVHGVDDAIQPSHPLSPPSPPAFNLSQHQGLLL